MKKLIISFVILIMVTGLLAKEQEHKIFIGYETLEMVMDNFVHFAGEIGYRFDEKNQIRITIMEVVLTERHLSSKLESKGVDGDDVSCLFKGYELHYDRFLSKYFYLSGSIGYFNDTYIHNVLDEEEENKTFTVGSGIGYKRIGFLGFNQLYCNLDIPVRYYFDNIEETELGATTILEHTVINDIWFFIGYEF